MSGTAVAAAGGHHPHTRSFAGLRPIIGPPLRRAKPAPSAPDLGPAAASPWQPVTHAAPFFPGTMLLASDGTVLVHSEPAAGGTSAWCSDVLANGTFMLSQA